MLIVRIARKQLKLKTWVKTIYSMSAVFNRRMLNFRPSENICANTYSYLVTLIYSYVGTKYISIGFKPVLSLTLCIFILI